MTLSLRDGIAKIVEEKETVDIDLSAITFKTLSPTEYANKALCFSRLGVRKLSESSPAHMMKLNTYKAAWAETLFDININSNNFSQEGFISKFRDSKNNEVFILNNIHFSKMSRSELSKLEGLTFQFCGEEFTFGKIACLLGFDAAQDISYDGDTDRSIAMFNAEFIYLYAKKEAPTNKASVELARLITSGELYRYCKGSSDSKLCNVSFASTEAIDEPYLTEVAGPIDSVIQRSVNEIIKNNHQKMIGISNYLFKKAVNLGCEELEIRNLYRELTGEIDEYFAKIKK